MKTVEKLWSSLRDAVIAYLPNFVSALVILAVGFFAALIIVHIARKIMTRHHLDPSLIAFVCRTVRFLVYTFAVLAALSALKISVTGILALFSAAAAAIALALKDRLNDIASGIVILFTKPFVTGDYIEFDKYKGYVQKIDITHTNLLTNDRTNVIIPNSVISASQVNNYTSQPVIRVQANVPIPYDADINRVKEILLQMLQKTDLLVHDEEHVDSVNLETFGDSALQFSVRCFCDFKDYWTVYYSVMQGAKEALDQNGITIPFNQLDVHLIK